MRFTILPFILLLPLIEITGFILVGQRIGVLATIGLILLSTVVGLVLLRVSGFSVFSRVQRDLRMGKDPGKPLVQGLILLIAAILLIIPGFFTDIIGLLLLLPPVRALVWNSFRKNATMSGSWTVFTDHPAPPRDEGKIVDLDEKDYKRKDDGASPWRRVED